MFGRDATIRPDAFVRHQEPSVMRDETGRVVLVWVLVGGHRAADRERDTMDDVV